MRMNKLLAHFAFALAFIAPVAQAQLMSTETLDGIVAIVDEDVVLRSELDRQVNAIVTQYASNPQQLPPREVLERQVLDRLIMTKLQVERADGMGVKMSDAEVDQTVAQIAQQNRMDVSQLRQAIAQQGLGWEQFRSTVRDESIVQRLRQRVVMGRVQVSDTEVDLALKNGGVKRGELHLGHILITLPDGATPDQIAAAQAKADDVTRQIQDGLDFKAAAIRYSDAPNALEGGDLGVRQYDELPSAFAEIADRLQVGETSPAIRGPNGFHIIKLIDKRAASAQVVTEYHARHILIKKTEVRSSDEARAKVELIRERLVAGEDFAKLAKEFSEDGPTANLGGDMGWFTQNGYGPRVGRELALLTDGQLSAVFDTDAGWHVLELLATRTQDKTQEAERDQARQMIGARKADEEYESFLRQMRSDAFIEIRLPGSQGASGN
jgi:peptidyl-prolyl cis-trans isomerase SurA